MNEARRVMAIWCPDWPVVAAIQAENLPGHLPVAVVDKGAVLACSPAARSEGVRRGVRKRDASARCPQLLIVDHQPELDAQAFEHVLGAVEDITPGVEPIRPGLCALNVPSRYYGGESEAAAVMAEKLVAAGVWNVRIGIADDLFSAEQAARLAPVQDHYVVAPGGSAAFLAGLPIDVLADDRLVGLLRQLGITTLGGFARLPARDVWTRFGTTGAWAHRLARGQHGRGAVGRIPPPELDQHIDFDPGLETVEPIAFSSRATAQRFVAELYGHGQVCTAITIGVGTESGWRHDRRWKHPRWFDAGDIVDRLRWQLQSDPPPDLVAQVLLIPDTTESVADQDDGLWGSAPDERVQSGIARVQSMIGYDQVQTARLQGGREPADRQQLTPWGEQPAGCRDPGLPWPGRLPPPAPSRIFAEPLSAAVAGQDGQPVRITDRGVITAEPASFRPADTRRWLPIEAWIGPWPTDERWWEDPDAQLRARFQIVAPDGSAWLLAVSGEQWWIEARYD
jgi:protein ImuB